MWPRLVVEQHRQDVADHQPLDESQGQVLVFAEAKTLPHALVEGLVPSNGPSNRAGGFGFATHASKAGNRWLDNFHAQQGPQPAGILRKNITDIGLKGMGQSLRS